MAQRVATPQGAKRRYPGFSSPPGLHAEESESRRPPYPPPGSMGGLQAPQVGVSVVTIDMFREYQRQVAANFERQGSQIALLQERVQSMEGRIQSLEDAEDMAIDAVREIRDGVIPRVEQNKESLETLTVAVTRQNTIIDAWGSLGQEFRANQGRDSARPGQLAWRPGPLGGAGDQTKSALEEMKTQLTRSFASLAEHDRRLAENDSHLGTHGRHLTDHERRVGEHDTRLAAHDRHLGDHSTRIGAHDRHFGEQNARLGVHEGHLRDHDVCVAKHNDRMGALDKANEQLNGRVAALEQRTDHGLSPAQIRAIMQNHQQRLESLEQTLQQHIKVSQEAQATKPTIPHSQPRSASGDTQTPMHPVASETHNPPDQQGKPSEKTQNPESPSRKNQRQHEETNHIPELKRLSEHLDTIDKRLVPLEQRINLVEKECEKLSHSATTPESIAKDPASEEEGQYEILSQTNFQRQEDLAGLRINEDSQLLMQLFSEKDKCEDACYTVQRACVHMWSYLLCRSRKDERLISDFWKREEWLNYPTIIELERNTAMPKGKYFPRYVYEIGEIFNRKVVTKYNGRQATHRSTGYHLVVDVTKPEKSLWLIYRYEEVSGDGHSLKQSITYKQDNFWHPFASVCEFDIAMIFERFEDWKGTDTPVGSFVVSKKLVRQTAALIRPTFIEPVLQEVKDEIRRSWEASAKVGALRR
ncbi:hypothetical protein ANO14919_087070 [Xylariales sp. No.14919]|nr:hypothetical protein F5X98DRAFT_129347 [Xylaria grammica]GAW19222.1 hypothetical protein ANO14919_087070 [Xylariales sp. No.14919]